MVTLKAHLWSTMKKSLIGYWAMILLFSFITYLSLIGWIRKNEINSSLQIANNTISDAIEVGDWDLALKGLHTNVSIGSIYNLKLTSPDLKTTFAGPIGEKKFGFGSYCSSTMSKQSLSLSGCVPFLNLLDTFLLIILTILSATFLIISFLLLRARSLKVFENISNLLITTDTNTYSRSPIHEIHLIRSQINSLLNEVEEKSKLNAFAEVAVQVAHDIRSPISALKVLIDQTNTMNPEEKHFFDNIIKRIEHIANNLLNKYKDDKKIKSNLVSLKTILGNIIQEKKLSLKEQSKIKLITNKLMSSNDFFVMVDADDLSRVISNLVNNSLEAIDGPGEIELTVYSENNSIVLSIRDTGKGIPADILPIIGKRNLTHGKPNGTGLGINCAIETMQKWGGRVVIDSEINKGTNVKLYFPVDHSDPKRGI